MQLKRVVVTGIGAITPLGNTAEAYWDRYCREKAVRFLLHILMYQSLKPGLPVR